MLSPNEGIHRSLKNGLLLFASGLVLGLGNWPFFGLTFGLVLGLVFGLLGGLAAATRQPHF